MIKIKLICLLILFIGCKRTEENHWQIKEFILEDFKAWNNDIDFSNLYFETGKLKEAIYFEGLKDSWGLISYAWSFSKPYLPITTGEIKIKNGIAFLLAEHYKGRSFGVTSITQGNIWNSKEKTKWNYPNPLKVKNKKLILDFEVQLLEAKEEFIKYPFLTWLMMGVNVWFRSKKLNKPLVMDLMFYHKGPIFTQEDDVAYHFQYVLSSGKKDFGKWKKYSVDLNYFINEALKRFKIEYAKEDLEIVELDILVEAMNAKGSFKLKKFALYFKEE
jgi:hypothetical protein